MALSMDEREEQGDENVGWYMLFTDFVDRTTAHGIPHVNNAKGILKKTVWTFFALCAVAGLMWHLQFLINKLLSHNVSVSVSIETSRSLALPAITICNHNAVMQSKMSSVSDVESIISSFTPGRKKRSVENSDKTKEPKIHHRQKRDRKPSEQNAGLTRNPLFELQEEVRDIIADLTEPTKMAIGHQRDNLILECQYNGYGCNISADFDHIYNSVYGNCFVYNWGKNGNSVLQSYKPGASNGLTLTFNLQQNEYVGYLTETAGLRVLVHSQTAMPFPEDEGVSVSPGEITFIGIRKLSVDRLPLPYGPCTVSSDYSKNVYAEYFGVGYTLKACQATCFQQHVISECGCFDVNFPSKGQAFGNAVVNACSSNNETQVICEDRILDDYNEGILPCSCTEPCSEDIYMTSTSATSWPADNYKNTLFTSLMINAEARKTINSNDSTEYQRNFGKVNVFFEEFNYENITESPAYDVGSLFSDIGGILGLYVGFSVLTILEFFEVIIDLLVWASCTRGCSKNNQTAVEDVRKKSLNEYPGYFTKSPRTPMTTVESADV